MDQQLTLRDVEQLGLGADFGRILPHIAAAGYSGIVTIRIHVGPGPDPQQLACQRYDIRHTVPMIRRETPVVVPIRNNDGRQLDIMSLERDRPGARVVSYAERSQPADK